MSSPQRSELIGREFARRRVADGEARRLFPVLLIGVLLAALLLTALRIDLIRLRYGLAEAMKAEKALLEERRELTAQVGRARGPGRLAGLAEKGGFVLPERVIELDGSRGTTRP
jgi:hypothetical protein